MGIINKALEILVYYHIGLGLLCQYLDNYTQATYNIAWSILIYIIMRNRA